MTEHLVVYEKLGDFWECAVTEELARRLGAILGSTPTRRGDGRWTVGIPYWRIDEARELFALEGLTLLAGNYPGWVTAARASWRPSTGTRNAVHAPPSSAGYAPFAERIEPWQQRIASKSRT